MQPDSGLVLIKRYFDLVEANSEKERLLGLLPVNHYHIRTRLLSKSNRDVWGLFLSHFALQELVNYALEMERQYD